MNILRKTPILFSFLSMCLFAFCFCTATTDPGDDEKKVKKIIKNVKETLFYLHYNPKAVDDDFSKEVFDNYIEFLDPTKRYLTNSDVDYFKNDVYNLDDYFDDQKLDFYYSTVDTIYKRIADSEKLVGDILKQPFDFNKSEELAIDYDKVKYASSQKELKEKWRKYLKYSVLTEVYEMQEDSTNIDKDVVTLEKEARETVKENFEDYFRRIKKRKKSNYLSGYINAFTAVYDPHTQYFSPREQKDFEQNISGRLQGIGARLRDDKGYATITELIVGGPAWKSEQLEVDDQILKVQQGKKGEPVNIVGMLLEESIELIKGKKDTEVVLTVKKKDGEIKTVSLVRDIIEISETFARSSIIKDENGDKFGLVYLPEFYIDFNDRKNGRDASEDVKKEIEELKKQNIKGLVFDLRSNGGGSLSEVVEIVGLFIDKGPVVQVKAKDGRRLVHEDEDKGITYDGNLVVLVNEFSASASEIMAAALQDYKRAVVIGTSKTYGKGTVQSIYPLNRWGKEDYGAIKMTIQKYYRVNGGSTQKNGVNSDIVIPQRISYEQYSEAEQPNALDWDQINEAIYKPYGRIDYDYIIAKSQSRLKDDPIFALTQESANYWKMLEDNESITLNLESFKQLMDSREKETKRFDALKDYENKLKFESPEYEIAKIEQDSILGIKRENWHESLTHDFELQEAVNVLEDMRVKPLLTEKSKSAKIEAH